MPSAPEPKRFRRDIQGLRAFAVIVVVLDHLFRWPSGGFIGVDVFFVISGFLISGTLVREAERTGWISFKTFYIKRARRILPAAMTVLLVTVAAAYLVWPTLRADETLLAGFASLFFVANWHFALTGADYLQADGPISPLQHFWSLGVEEQFYIVWPWLVVLVFFLASRTGKTAKYPRILFWAFLSVIAASFLVSLVVTAKWPAIGYFETVSRVWELGVGAMLSLVGQRLAKFSGRNGALLQWAGLVVLVVAAFVITPESRFPGPWAVLPVLGAAMIIAGGSAAGLRENPVLTNPVARYVGDISYSLYLWHFPVIIFTTSLLGQGPAESAVMIVLMAGLSVFSYHQIENRFRGPRTKPVRKARTRRTDLAIAASVTAVVMGMTAVQMFGPDGVKRPSSPLVAQPAVTKSVAPWDDATLSQALERAAAHNEWPDGAMPVVRDFGDADKAPHLIRPPAGCMALISGDTHDHRCVREGSGDDSKVAVVVGDSIALSWAPAVEAALPGWTVYTMGYSSCPAIPAPIGSGTSSEQCSEAQQTMINYAASVNADLVITSALQNYLNGLESGRKGAAAAAEWEQATADFISRFPDSSVVVLGNPPAGPHPEECIVRWGDPQSCTSTIDASWESKARAEKNAAEQSGATFIDPSQWFCTDDGRCPLYADATMFRIDKVHLTHQASTRLGGVLAEPLLTAATSR